MNTLLFLLSSWFNYPGMLKMFSEYNLSTDDLERRVNEVFANSGKVPVNRNKLLKLLGLLDLTTLEGSDTEEKVAGICSQARFSAIDPSYPDAAAVCVYPSLVHVARKSLHGTGISIASVAGGFPSGQTSLRVKLEEVRFAIGEGAGEIDTVISRGKLIEGNDNEVFDELSAIREACGTFHLKVILETGELTSVELVRKASEISILAGADFIKTSTGKITTGATPAAFLIMLDTTREYLEKTGKTVGIKAAGGVRTPSQALLFADLFIEVMGESLLSPAYFRIGASSLAGEILKMA
jgi:deoxyribose-phosphate aldolase